MAKLAVIIAEYGRPAPDIAQYRKCWPGADIQVFSGSDLPDTPQLDPSHARYGWRMNDYWKVRMLLDSGADVAISFDADMRIVDFDAARTLTLLAARFGLCLPMNPRYTVRRDFQDGADVRACIDQTLWNAPGVNCSPIALNLHHAKAIDCAERYCRFMIQSPMRGPMAWWGAMWTSGFAPLILPPQWCVCEKHIGCGDEIILHEGHAAVKRHYANVRLG